MIALDMVGLDGSGNTRIYSPGPAGSPSRRLAEFMALHAPEGVPGFVLDVKDAPDRAGRYSDHISFSDAGYPAVRFIQPQEDPSNHSPDDTADHVNPDYVKRITQVVLAGLHALAWGDETFNP
jgi:Zn-dependent M28 family amino/carboxypeptidase